jgi:lipoprotein signal peptidase
LAVSLLAASLIAEGVAFGKLRTDDAVAIFYLIEIAIGLLLPFILLRPRERLVGYGATLVLAVAMGIAIEPITVLVRSIADRF